MSAEPKTTVSMPSSRVARAPSTAAAGPRSPPIASTAMRGICLRSVDAERLDLAALVGAAGRADAVRALRLATRRADVDLRRADRVRRAPLVAAGLGGFPLRDGHRSGAL